MSRHHKHTERSSTGTWTTTQSYVLATVTLVVGLVVGYLFRGSEATASANTNTSTSVTGLANGEEFTKPGSGPELAVNLVEPLLKELQTRPNDLQLLNRIGNTYYDSKEYAKAIEYYEKSLAIKPDDPDVRTDMGTAIWYQGDADGALKQYERSLSYQPTHGHTLFNMGIVRWHGKKDPKGALEAWNKLLATNPSYPERQRVLELIQQVQSGGS